MKTKSIAKLTLLALASGGVALATVRAIESKDNQNPPGITVDERPLDRDGRLPASFAETIKKITPSVVKIEVTGKAVPAIDGGDLPRDLPFNGFDLRRFFRVPGDLSGRGGLPREHGSASGVIVTPDGYILTNHHVVDRADKVEVTTHDGRVFVAKVAGDDPKSDLAVLKVDASGLPAIAFADSDRAEVGDVVLAVGNPFGLGQSVTMGMISATGRATMGLDYENFIQTDAAINPGNSGGALVDCLGRLVGINTAIVSRGGGNDGIGFAIPSNMARAVLGDLVKDGKVKRAYLGVLVQDLTPALARQFHAGKERHGALVGEVPADSPAAGSGLREGDVIVGFAGNAVPDARALKLAVGSHKPGEKVEVKVLRDGEEKAFQVALADQPSDTGAVPARMNHGARDEGTLNGVGVADLDGASRRQAGIPAEVKGALVTDVANDSAAWEAGLRPGDVIEQINRQPVADASEAVRLTAHPAGRETLLRVWSRGSSRFVVVDETAANG